MMKIIAGLLLSIGSVCQASLSSLPLPTGDPARWSANPDGGNAPAVSKGEPYEGRPSLRFAYKNARGFGNSLLDGISIPPDAYGVRFKLFVEEAAPEAAMPTQTVETFGFTWFIVSTIARVAVTEPPGLLI